MTPLTRDQIEALQADYKRPRTPADQRVMTPLYTSAPDLAATALLAWTEDGKRLCRDVMLELVEHNGRFVRVAADALERAEAAELALSERDQQLGYLLAIIHRDGGHYRAEHGTEKALADAHERWGQLMQTADELATERARREACEAALREAEHDFETADLGEGYQQNLPEIARKLRAALNPAKEKAHE